MDSVIGIDSERSGDREGLLDRVNEHAEGTPEHATSFSDSAFMVRANFGAFDGPLLTDKYLKIGLVLQGDGPIYHRTQLGLLESSLYAGGMYYLPPSLRGEMSTAPMEMLGLCVNPEQFDVAEFSSLKSSDFEAAARDLFDDETVRSVMLALWHSSNGNTFSSAFFKEGVEVILNQLKLSGNKRRTTTYLRKTNEIKMRRLKAYIFENLDSSIRISDMARELGIEESQFFAICREMTGMTPFSYLTHNRMAFAQDLLREGASITEAALAVGYSNPSKFSAAFSRHFGENPSQWRRLQS